MSSHLIFRDTPSILFVNKPPNVPFHNSDISIGAVTLLRQHLGPNYPRIYPVHRLDAMTSGVMMFAKSPEIAREIIQKFRTRKISKYYVAISSRKPSKKMGNVIGDMARGRRGSWMLQRTTENPAITRFIGAAIPGRPGKAAFLLKPETGKTHQLRVALKSLGAPVLGDVRYANATDAEKEVRGYLHCAALRLFIGNTLYQVVCHPSSAAHFSMGVTLKGNFNFKSALVDSEFNSDGFQQLFGTWFPPGIEENMGVWFPETKLLRSTPESLMVLD